MIEKGDWVRVLRNGEYRGRIGEVLLSFADSGAERDFVQYQVDLFGEPRFVGIYGTHQLTKLTEMEVLAEASRGL